MTAAYNWIDAKHFTSKIAPAGKLITLCGVDWKLVQFLEPVAPQILLDILIAHKHVIRVAEATTRIAAGMKVLGQHYSVLYLEKCAGVCELTFRLVRNDRPAH